MAAGAVPTLLCCQSGATPGHPGHAATTVPNRTHCTGIFDVGVSPAPTLPITHRRGQRLEDTLCSLASLVPLSLPLTEMFDWMVDGGMMLLYLWKNSELLGFMIRFYWAENGLNVLSLQEIWDLFWSQVLALHNPLLHPRKTLLVGSMLGWKSQLLGSGLTPHQPAVWSYRNTAVPYGPCFPCPLPAFCLWKNFSWRISLTKCLNTPNKRK